MTADNQSPTCLFFDSNGNGPSELRIIKREIREVIEGGETVAPRAFGLCWEVTGALHFVEDGGLMLDTEVATWLRDKLTAWLDAPRLAARETAEVVARDGNAVLLRTAFEWGCGGTAEVVAQDGDTVLPSAAFKWPPPSDDAALPAAYVVDWYAGPDAERNARSDYANARSLALCICGAEEDEDEIDRSGSSPLCRKCVAEAFKAQRFRCRETDCNVSCGWTGTGADLIAAGDTDGPGSPHECPKCCGWTVYEADDTTGGGQ